MKRISLFAAAAAAALAAMPADAEVRQYKANEAVTVDPALSYVVIRTNLGTDLRLFRLLGADDRQAWELARQEALAKAQKKYERDLKNYERDIKDWNESAAARRELRVKPRKPEPVTLENLPVAPAELANFQTVFRGREIAVDSDKTRTFLIAVRPGTYVIYGSVGLAIGVGNCLCMGSVAFAAEPGTIVDAGTVRAQAGDWYAPVDYIPPPAHPGVPAQLAGRQVVPAKVVASGKIANFFGTPVTRVNPVPGILGYDRDIPLDRAAGDQPIPAIR